MGFWGYGVLGGGYWGEGLVAWGYGLMEFGGLGGWCGYWGGYWGWVDFVWFWEAIIRRYITSLSHLSFSVMTFGL